MNDTVVNGAQGTEQWRHINRTRALIGECGEISHRGEQAVMVQPGAGWGGCAGVGRADGGRLLMNHKITGCLSYKGLCMPCTLLSQFQKKLRPKEVITFLTFGRQPVY